MNDQHDDDKPQAPLDPPQDDPTPTAARDGSPEQNNAPAGPNFSIPGLDIDPQEVLRDPISAMFKIFQDPQAIQAIESFIQTPMAQDMMQESMKNPLFQQLLGKDPFVANLFGGPGPRAPGPQHPTASPPPPASAPQADDEEEDEALDEPKLNLVLAPHGGPAFPTPEPHLPTLAQLTAGFPERFDVAPAPPLPSHPRDAAAAIARARLAHHLAPETIATLDAQAQASGLTNAIDLFINQGAFAGELAWYVICRLEDCCPGRYFTPLAKHALRCVTFACGYRVPSFLTQLVLFLAENDALDAQDLQYATWALSGQPRDGLDGVFEVTWQEVTQLIDRAAAVMQEPEHFGAFVAALSGWQIIDAENLPRTFRDLTAPLPAPRRPELGAALLTLLTGQDLNGVRFNRIADAVVARWVDILPNLIDLDQILRAAPRWPFAFKAAHLSLLQNLDLLWGDAPPAPRDAYLEHCLTHDDVEIRHFAYRVGAAWEPNRYLDRAVEDPSPTIRQWANRESGVR